jgi:hypothetical protein
MANAIALPNRRAPPVTRTALPWSGFGALFSIPEILTLDNLSWRVRIDVVWQTASFPLILKKAPD